MNRKEAGFTLIELMIVVVVLAIMLTVGLPAFQDLILNARISSTMHRLTTDMAMARSAAVMRGTPFVICPRSLDNRCSTDQNWAAGWLVFEDPDGDHQPGDPARILRITEGAAADSSVLDLRSSRPYLRYQPSGFSFGSNLTVYICHEERLSGTLVVNNGGRVRSTRDQGTLPCPTG